MVFRFGEHPSIDVLEGESEKKELSCEEFKNSLITVLSKYHRAKNRITDYGKRRISPGQFAAEMAEVANEIKENPKYGDIGDKLVDTVFGVAGVLGRSKFERHNVKLDLADAKWQGDMVRFINQHIDDSDMPSLISRTWNCFDAGFWEQSDIEPFISGVKGVVTASHLLQAAELEVCLPTPEEDVEHKVDLWGRVKQEDRNKIFAFQIKTSKDIVEPQLRKLDCSKEREISLKTSCKYLREELKFGDTEWLERMEIAEELKAKQGEIGLIIYINQQREENEVEDYEAYWMDIPGYKGIGGVDIDEATGKPKQKMVDKFIGKDIL